MKTLHFAVVTETLNTENQYNTSDTSSKILQHKSKVAKNKEKNEEKTLFLHFFRLLKFLINPNMY